MREKKPNPAKNAPAPLDPNFFMKSPTGCRVPRLQGDCAPSVLSHVKQALEAAEEKKSLQMGYSVSGESAQGPGPGPKMLCSDSTVQGEEEKGGLAYRVDDDGGPDGSSNGFAVLGAGAVDVTGKLFVSASVEPG